MSGEALRSANASLGCAVDSLNATLDELQAALTVLNQETAMLEVAVASCRHTAQAVLAVHKPHINLRSRALVLASLIALSVATGVWLTAECLL